MRLDPETELVTITWKLADIIEVMENKEFEVTELNLLKVLAYQNLKQLEDRSIEAGWKIICGMVEEAKLEKRKFSFMPNKMSSSVGCGANNYLDYTEAMRLLGLGRNTVSKLAREANAIRVIKGKYLIHMETLEKYIESTFNPNAKQSEM